MWRPVSLVFTGSKLHEGDPVSRKVEGEQQRLRFSDLYMGPVACMCLHLTHRYIHTDRRTHEKGKQLDMHLAIHTQSHLFL